MKSNIEIREDKRGNVPQVGDNIVYSQGYANTTGLNIGEVLSFTKGGNPRVEDPYEGRYSWGNTTKAVVTDFVII